MQRSRLIIPGKGLKVSFGAKYEADILRQSDKENREGVEYLKSLLMADGFAPGTDPMSREEEAQYRLELLRQLPRMEPPRAQRVVGEMDGFMEGEGVVPRLS